MIYTGYGIRNDGKEAAEKCHILYGGEMDVFDISGEFIG